MLSYYCQTGNRQVSLMLHEDVKSVIRKNSFYQKEKKKKKVLEVNKVIINGLIDAFSVVVQICRTNIYTPERSSMSKTVQKTKSFSVNPPLKTPPRWSWYNFSFGRPS